MHIFSQKNILGQINIDKHIKSKYLCLFVIVLWSLLSLIACQNSLQGEEKILHDFESDSELDSFFWRCHALFSLSDDHVTHGEKSLRLELYPSGVTGLAPMIENQDWRHFDHLRFDVFNTTRKTFLLSIWINDHIEYTGRQDLYSKNVDIKPGLNRVSIPLENLVTQGTKRKINLEIISNLFIFVPNLDHTVVFHIDYLRLDHHAN